MRRIVRGCLVVVLSVVASALPLGVVAAASPHVVDPDSVSPPLNPLYAPYDCWTAGTGITCQGDVVGTYGPELIDWFTCAGEDLWLVTGRERQHITRWHDADGNATKTTLQTEFRDVFSLDPSGAGPTVTLYSRFTKHYDYPVPGDRATRVMRQTGASFIARASAGGGVLAHETGWVLYEPGLEDEVIADLRGPKDLLDDFDGFVERTCEHLLGG